MSELEEGEMVEEGEIAVEQQPDVDKKEKLKRSAPEIPVPSPKRKKSRKDPVPQDKEDVFKRPNFLEKPWQESKSNVALDFNTWMSFKTPIRLISQDYETAVLEKILSPPTTQPYTLRTRNNEIVRNFLADPLTLDGPDAKLVLVPIRGCHPGFMAEQPLEEFQLFSKCSTMPCLLKRSLDSRQNASPVTEWMFHCTQKRVEIRDIPVDELFEKFELKFRLEHSKYQDRLILRPGGSFSRQSQNEQGMWKLDGDLLHLEWERQSKDVLQNHDGTHRLFESNPVLDKTYCAEGSKPQRHMKLILLEAIPYKEPPKTDEMTAEQEIAPVDHEYYIMSHYEMTKYNYPIDIETEQTNLNEQTQAKTPDRYGSLPVGDGCKIYALDCEMCETDLGNELTRVTVVNFDGVTVYDTLVKPLSKIINYFTEFSGITKELLADVAVRLEDVQKHLQSFMCKSTILVGHSIENDLRALRLVHHRVIDTAILYPHPRGYPFRSKLKGLCEQYLDKVIQNNTEDGHDSAEDALSALELYKLKMKNGPDFGLPQLALSKTRLSSDTMMDRLKEWKPEATASFFIVSEYAKVAKKPWERYITGEMNEFDTMEWIEQSQMENINQINRFASFDELQSNVVDHLKTSTTNDSVLWIELKEDKCGDTMLFISDRQKWEEEQQLWMKRVDECMNSVYHALPVGSVMILVPQYDLSHHRELRARRLQSRWNDSHLKWTEKDTWVLKDVLSGTQDSAMFICQKKTLD